jgi:hypothetical protein
MRGSASVDFPGVQFCSNGICCRSRAVPQNGLQNLAKLVANGWNTEHYSTAMVEYRQRSRNDHAGSTANATDAENGGPWFRQ